MCHEPSEKYHFSIFLSYFINYTVKKDTQLHPTDGEMEVTSNNRKT